MPVTNGSYSGLFDRFYGQGYTSLNDSTGVPNNTNEFNATLKRSLAKMVKQKGDRVLARILYTLTGAAAGSNASETLAQITAAAGVSGGANDPLSQGGKRTVAPVSLVNRATTAADAAAVQDILTRQFAPASYPVDKAGNGGGAKVGGF